MRQVLAISRIYGLVDKYGEILPRLANKLEVDGEETLSCYSFPKEHRKRIRSTNCLERVHQEIKRRGRVIWIFANEASCIRLCTSVVMDISDEWVSGRRYLDMGLLGDNILQEVSQGM